MKMEGKLPIGRPTLRWRDTVRKDMEMEGKHPRGRPTLRWRDTVRKDMKAGKNEPQIYKMLQD